MCGYRGENDQNAAFANGNSKLKFPNSKHNQLPSLAVDVAPLPLDWNNVGAFLKMVQLIKVIANKQGVKIRCGADFEKFKDYPHVELV